MLDKDLIEIKVSRVIHAPKWRVMRLITKVWDFPKYIPLIKEVSVIQKGYHKMRTKWQVEVDNIPITWIEEDVLAFDRNTIYFNAIEGDLQDFKGEWKFRSHPEGTEVIVNASLKMHVPIIKEFVDVYIEKLLTKNFEVILETIERRLISIKYSSFRHGDTDKIAGFAIIGHL